MTKPYRILVVDDVADNLSLLEAYLESEGYEVELASDGISALAKVQAAPPDLILLDVMMPGMTGYEVIWKLRRNHRFAKIPILLVSAHEAPAQTKQLLGVEGFIRKPIDFDQLLARVKAVLLQPKASQAEANAKAQASYQWVDR